MRRVLLLWLDGYDPGVADALIAVGRLPALARLRAESARVTLDHGSARWTGLAGEHLSTGLSPDEARRHAAVHFDRTRYTVWQEGTARAPFPTALAARTVVFDPPYFDLAKAPDVRGIVDWGAHDPGTSPAARPAALRDEIAAGFGPYPATPWIYGFVWPSAAKTQTMGEALAKASDVRAAAAHWLLAERCPDWELAIVVSSELHSASEALWHGYDSAHPLNALTSAAPARAGFLAVYDAVDRLVARLGDAFADAVLVVCSLHGMGPNKSDLPSMALLPEVLFRDRFGRAFLRGRSEWNEAARALPLLDADASWSTALAATLAPPEEWDEAMRAAASDCGDNGAPPWPAEGSAVARLALDWLPATWYSRFWPAMPAFALPSFYDGRIRINLAGREGRGCVRDYDAACNRVEQLLRTCSDLRTGAPVVASIERRRDPMARGPSEADMLVLWNDLHAGFRHPTLGPIGPLPPRRSGGHTGGPGVAFVRGAAFAPGDYGTRSAFDIVPTIVDLLGERLARVSGTSFLPALARATARLAAE